MKKSKQIKILNNTINNLDKMIVNKDRYIEHKDNVTNQLQEKINELESQLIDVNHIKELKELGDHNIKLSDELDCKINTIGTLRHIEKELKVEISRVNVERKALIRLHKVIDSDKDNIINELQDKVNDLESQLIDINHSDDDHDDEGEVFGYDLEGHASMKEKNAAYIKEIEKENNKNKDSIHNYIFY